MKKAERRKMILEQLQKTGSMTIKDLEHVFHVSGETIRTDIHSLVSQSLVIKEHGKIRINHAFKEMPLAYRSSERMQSKRSLAVRAFKEIKNGQIVYIDGGSTTLSGIEALQTKSGITVVTDSFPIAQRCLHLKIKTIILGGEIDCIEQRTNSYFAIRMLENIHIDLAVLGTLGVQGTDGFTTLHPNGTALLRTVLQQTDQIIVLCDSNRFKEHASYIYTRFREIDMLITRLLTNDQRKIFSAIPSVVEVG